MVDIPPGRVCRPKGLEEKTYIYIYNGIVDTSQTLPDLDLPAPKHRSKTTTLSEASNTARLGSLIVDLHLASEYCGHLSISQGY